MFREIPVDEEEETSLSHCHPVAFPEVEKLVFCWEILLEIWAGYLNLGSSCVRVGLTGLGRSRDSYASVVSFIILT